MEKSKMSLKSGMKSNLNKKAREFKPKAKTGVPSGGPSLPPPMMVQTPPIVGPGMPPIVTAPGQRAKIMLPPQAPSAAPTAVPPSMKPAFPPGMEWKFENGKLIIPDAVPTGLRKMLEQAQEEGKFDEMIMASLGKTKPKPAQDEYELTPEEEMMAEQFLLEQQAMEPCPFFLQGKCKFGKSCDLFHPTGLEDITGSIDFEGDQEWCICNEMILANNRQFGLLDGCQHAFCLECIRNWRATYIKRMSKEQMRACPLWRQTSYLVIPSQVYIPNGDAKAYLIEEYQTVLGDIPCRHFNYGKGECPFLNSWFYAHYTKDGKKFDYSIKAKYLNEDGEVVTEKEDEQCTLADLIGL